MEWYYLIIFILAVMVPRLVTEDIFGLSPEMVEEIIIFILGLIGFAFFLTKRYQLRINIIEKEKEHRKLQQTAKDLVESYSYIGEINRKMDLLMQIGIGLTNHGNIEKHKENEIYKSILEASNFLLKAETSLLMFVDTRENRIKKELCLDNKCGCFNRSPEFLKMEKNVFIKKEGEYMIATSQKEMGGVRAYLIAKSFDQFQANDNNNQEILKYMASQALFLYSSSQQVCYPAAGNKKTTG